VRDGEEGKVIRHDVRGAAISAFALTGAGVIGGTVIPRAASVASLPAIGRVKCQSTTFNVLYGADREVCNEGTGEITTRVGAVFAISRGEHRLELTHGTWSRIVNLAPRMKIAFSPADQWEFVLIDITRTWRATRGSPIGGGDAFVRTVSEQSRCGTCWAWRIACRRGNLVRLLNPANKGKR
jgi:hypothetical protein